MNVWTVYFIKLAACGFVFGMAAVNTAVVCLEARLSLLIWLPTVVLWGYIFCIQFMDVPKPPEPEPCRCGMCDSCRAAREMLDTGYRRPPGNV